MQIICLMGPTAAGKTQIAIDLTRQFPLEIISVDSAMVYRGLDIGTAKPSAAILREVPHHLINICDPAEAYSAAQFCEDALKKIKDITGRQRVPLLVGGTMMYFRALQKGLADLPAADPTLRAALTTEGEQLGWPTLHDRLKKIDPQGAARVHPHDQQRIQRALEVYLLTGKTLTTWQSMQRPNSFSPYEIHNLIIAPADRVRLHQRIAERFDQMLTEGLIEEVKILFRRTDLTLELPSLRSVGYRQIWEYLQEKYLYEEMRARAIIATRQLAKRQFTWLRQWPEADWFEEYSIKINHIVGNFLK